MLLGSQSSCFSRGFLEPDQRTLLLPAPSTFPNAGSLLLPSRPVLLLQSPKCFMEHQLNNKNEPEICTTRRYITFSGVQNRSLVQYPFRIICAPGTFSSTGNDKQAPKYLDHAMKMNNCYHLSSSELSLFLWVTFEVNNFLYFVFWIIWLILAFLFFTQVYAREAIADLVSLYLNAAKSNESPLLTLYELVPPYVLCKDSVFFPLKYHFCNKHQLYFSNTILTYFKSK